MNDRALADFLSALDADLARQDEALSDPISLIGSGERMYRAMERLAQAGVGDEQAAELLRADVERRAWMSDQGYGMA
ncbi:hypothetical protein [Brevundimonas variabilis]|uniref:Uncharacterized protein n=1 Tax=Brevundimonas variabilis TaxID=74312 RepID=A0A7W9FCT6_9CAUL|nr:hypothetical protein [Brevundimonas variabilis]MBB5744761.1 hypothetical protein [Brevundimonas variabilis]